MYFTLSPKRSQKRDFSSQKPNIFPKRFWGFGNNPEKALILQCFLLSEISPKTHNKNYYMFWDKVMYKNKGKVVYHFEKVEKIRIFQTLHRKMRILRRYVPLCA